MANQATKLKGVTVEEIAKTSLAEAGLFTMSLSNGASVVAIANVLWPMHDRNLYDMVMRFLDATKPDLVVLLGHMINNEAFQALFESEKNYLNKPVFPPEVLAAKAAGSFDDQVQHLRRAGSAFISSFANCGAKVVYVPGILTEHKAVKRVLQEKERRDAYMDNHPDASDRPSDPDRKIPINFRDFLYLNGNPRIRVLPYNAALLVNDHSLFMIGDFKRRNEGDAALVEWQQRHFRAIIRSLNGSLASGWFSTTEHTQPTLTKVPNQAHEIGYLWDEVANGQMRDYDRRAPGFFAGRYIDNELFGSTIVILRGNDGKRAFYAPDGDIYEEPTAGAVPNGTEITLADEEISPDDDWHIPSDADQEADDEAVDDVVSADEITGDGGDAKATAAKTTGRKSKPKAAAKPGTKRAPAQRKATGKADNQPKK